MARSDTLCTGGAISVSFVELVVGSVESAGLRFVGTVISYYSFMHEWH